MKFTYDYFFGKAMEQDGKQQYEDAIANLFMASYCIKNKQVEEMLTQYVASVSYNEYQLEFAFVQVITGLIKEKYYLETYELFRYVIYEMYSENLKLQELMSMFRQTDALTLYKLLEITVNERGNGMDDEDCFIEGFINPDDELALQDVKEEFREIQLLVMRIWFGMNYSLKKELVDFSIEKKLSVPALAVIMKYSVAYDDCRQLFLDVASLFRKEGYEMVSGMLEKYASILSENDEGQFRKETRSCLESMDMQKTEKKSTVGNRMEVRYIHVAQQEESIASDQSVQSEELGKKTSSRDEDTIAVIMCSNQERYQEECLLYLERQILPDDFKLEVLIATDALGMCQGYNVAMKQTRAKYKIFMHHDTLLVNENCLWHTVQLLSQDDSIGLLGIAGAKAQAENGIWWEVDQKEQLYSLFQYVGLGVNVIRSHPGRYDVSAIDGVFMATTKDVPWREDLFTGWHFYDVAQCREYEKAGWKNKVFCDYEPWLWHKLTITKGYLADYEQYRQVYMKEYFGMKENRLD